MNILIASSICPQALDSLRQRHNVKCAFNADQGTLKSLIEDCEALVFRSGVSITADVMACAPCLRLLVRAGSGLDNLDLEYTRSRGLTLVRIPQPGAQAVAEMAFALMLAMARQLLEADRLLRRGRWVKHELNGFLLSGKTLGIIGAGNIGTRVGQMGVAWGMKVVGCVEEPIAAKSAELSQQSIRLAGIDDVMRSADFLSIHVPLQESTRNLINATTLSLMKPGAFLVNLARGGVADEAALYDALTANGGLAGAALDVHEQEGEGKISPLAKLSNVVLTPHIGAMTIDSQRDIGRRILDVFNGRDSGMSDLVQNGILSA